MQKKRKEMKEKKKKEKEKKEMKKEKKEMKEKEKNEEEMKIFIHNRKVEEKWCMELVEVKWTEND